MSTQVLRWDVPVDDRWHWIGAGPVLHVAVRDLPGIRTGELVEVWTREPANREPVRSRSVCVFGTGHKVPDDGVHVGSAVVPGVRLVWHVFAGAATADPY